MSLFMSHAALVRFTGYSQKSRQVAFLKQRGLHFEMNANGEPVVPLATLTGGAVETAQSTQQHKPWMPPVMCPQSD